MTDDVYRAIADPTRRAILDELTERSGQTLFELCTRLAMKHGLGSSRQAISQHLDVLESAGLVRIERAGRYVRIEIETAPLRGIVERWLTSPAFALAPPAPEVAEAAEAPEAPDDRPGDTE